ncbi:MAG: zinc ribbon domain-containing protein [Anaerolineae bacterium]
MPLYEYDCPGCGRMFDKLVSIAKADSAECPHCGNTHPKRRLARISIKGTSQGGGSAVSLPTFGST